MKPDRRHQNPGRPKLAPEKRVGKPQNVRVYAADEAMRRIKDIASRNLVSVAEVIRKALCHYTVCGHSELK